MSGIEVPIKYGSNDGVRVQIYFIDLTKRSRSTGNVGTIRLSDRVEDSDDTQFVYIGNGKVKSFEDTSPVFIFCSLTTH